MQIQNYVLFEYGTITKPRRHLTCYLMSIYLSSFMHHGELVACWKARTKQVVSSKAGWVTRVKNLPAESYRLRNARQWSLWKSFVKNYTRFANWLYLQSALIAVRLTALADSHISARRVACCSVCQWITSQFFPPLVHWKVLWPLQGCDHTRPRLEFSRQQCYIFRPCWGLLRHTQAEPGIIKSRRYNNIMEQNPSWG
jgi:hypothetical protein